MSGKSELHLFEKLSPQVVIENAIFQDVHPSTSLSANTSNIEFLINGSQSEYLDLNDTFLYVKCQAINEDGSKLTVDTCPVNYTLNSLFSDITLALNEVVIEGGNHLYPYKATIESIFNFNEDAKRIQLLPAGFSELKDERKKWINKSQVCEFVGALRLDFLNQPKYLLPSVNVRITMSRSRNGFSFMDCGVTEKPKFEILDAVLYIRRVKVAPAVQLGHQKGLLKRNAIYPYTRSQTISYSISTGSLTFFKENLFGNALSPKFVIVCMIKSSAYTGNYNANSFDFAHFDVKCIGLFRDGQSLPHRQIYQPDFTNKLFTCDYVKSIIHNTQHLNTNLNNGITMSDFYKEEYCFFTFNITPDFDMTQVQVPRDGNLRLDMRFAKPLTEAINVIIYATFDAEIQITNAREIINDAH